MGRLAGAFDSWRNMASQLAHERHLVRQSVARLQHMVRIIHGICNSEMKKKSRARPNGSQGVDRSDSCAIFHSRCLTQARLWEAMVSTQS